MKTLVVTNGEFCQLYSALAILCNREKTTNWWFQDQDSQTLLKKVEALLDKDKHEDTDIQQ